MIPTQIYENFSSSRQQASQQQTNRFSTKATIEAKPSSPDQKIQHQLPIQQQNHQESKTNGSNPRSQDRDLQREGSFVMQREGSFVMQREGSFVRTGSGRKLPKIPHSKDSSSKVSDLLNTSLPATPLKLDTTQEEDILSNDKQENRKSKPKALEFWESLETVDRADFRYNTIHRMSVGRRMLPKAPGSANPSDHARSHSLDRGGGSLNSSFSGEHDAVVAPRQSKHRMDSESSAPSSPPPNPGSNQASKIPPDGCSLQSHGSSGAQPSKFNISRLAILNQLLTIL